MLPIVTVGTVAFEKVCRDILKLLCPEIANVGLKRTSGAWQFGVDVESFDDKHFLEVITSAKSYQQGGMSSQC